MVENGNKYLLDLLSEWQSLHSLIPLHLRELIDDLNKRTGT